MTSTIPAQLEAPDNPPWVEAEATPKRPANGKRSKKQLIEQLFTDAALAEKVAKECLVGTYCRTNKQTWWAWNNVHWESVDPGLITEAIRQYVIQQYADALDAERQRVQQGEKSDRTEIEEWHKIQAAGRIAAILSLAGNIEGVLLNAADFDTHHDLLNTPGGVLDLRTGELGPHDPALLITKVTTVRYRPDAKHPAWEKILESVPEDSRDWLQVRLGQAITGHMTDDERMVLLSGGGRNGKTTLMNTVFETMGGYAAAVPNTLLLAGRQVGQATPEKMTIRGVRVGYIEETPEDRNLDSNALKEVIGTPTVQGRELYKGFVSFGATHSLFLNTNYPPRVTETDEGTWRRLARLDFPYRFVPPGRDLDRETDRPGDPTLKAKLRSTEAKEAALAWLVEGTRRWYEAKTLSAFPDPQSVIDATRKWRYDSDLILRYLDEWMEYDRDSYVTTVDLYQHFREWSRAQGHQDISQTTLTSRLKAHTALPEFVGVKRLRTAKVPGRSRPSGSFAGIAGSADEPEQSMSIVGIRYRGA